MMIGNHLKLPTEDPVRLVDLMFFSLSTRCLVIYVHMEETEFITSRVL